MAVVTHNGKLNELLIEIGRSLLQYVAASAPWTDQAMQMALTHAAAEQSRNVGRLTHLLFERRWPIDFGTFPGDYAGLHFLSLDYILPQLVCNQAAIVEELDEAVHTCADDIAAAELLQQTLRSERALLIAIHELHLSRLTQMTGERGDVSPLGDGTPPESPGGLTSPRSPN